ncbi:MAG: alpha/beta fold hydrolase [Bacteroidia bacterium]|nr:alpha/beta fold hydrolase [Bacteroidia bacterium]
MKNFDKPEILNKSDGYFFGVRDGHHLFIYNYTPVEKYNSTIFIISGITGINHHNEKDLIGILSNDENRVVVIYPRGTGYSEGIRGDISNFEDFINDFSEIISNDKDYGSVQHKIFLYGHSMSAAILLAAVCNLKNIAGAILVNPAYILKNAKGMSPGFFQYIKYAYYYFFAKHTPIVNMAGDSSQIENEEDRHESELRNNNPLLVKYFSLYVMTETKKLMESMLVLSKAADFPLLLLYGEKDNIVEKKGCDLIYENWKHHNKQYVLIENGSHGKSTLLLACDIIKRWIKNN